MRNKILLQILFRSVISRLNHVWGYADQSLKLQHLKFNKTKEVKISNSLLSQTTQHNLSLICIIYRNMKALSFMKKKIQLYSVIRSRESCQSKWFSKYMSTSLYYISCMRNYFDRYEFSSAKQLKFAISISLSKDHYRQRISINDFFFSQIYNHFRLNLV